MGQIRSVLHLGAGSRLAANRTAALNARWFDAATGEYRADAETETRATQCAQGLALARGLVPGGAAEAAARRALVALARRDGHLTTGMFGLHPALAALSESGADGHAAALALVGARGFPGFRYMLDEKGATTLWEAWFW